MPSSRKICEQSIQENYVEMLRRLTEGSLQGWGWLTKRHFVTVVSDLPKMSRNCREFENVIRSTVNQYFENSVLTRVVMQCLSDFGWGAERFSPRLSGRQFGLYKSWWSFVRHCPLVILLRNRADFWQELINKMFVANQYTTIVNVVGSVCSRVCSREWQTISNLEVVQVVQPGPDPASPSHVPQPFGECCVCLEYTATQGCVNGHVICDQCYERVNICPMCRGSMASFVTLTQQKMIKALLLRAQA